MQRTLILGAFVLGLAGREFMQKEPATTMRLETLELVDPSGKGSVKLSAAGGQLVCSSDAWANALEVRIGKASNQIGIEVRDTTGQRAFLGVRSDGGGPVVEVRDGDSGPRAVLDIKPERGPGLIIDGSNEISRAFIGTQPDGSSMLALFDPKGTPGIWATAGAKDQTNGLVIMEPSTEEIGVALLCPKTGRNTVRVVNTQSGTGAFLTATEKGYAIVQLGSSDADNGVAIQGGGKDPARLQIFGPAGCPLAGLLPSDDGMSLVLCDKSGKQVFVAPHP